MKKLTILFIVSGFYFPSFVYAQSDIDALRYSLTSLNGTARFVGMGGAFGALGADFSTLSYNPAGIGLYRHSQFTFTPSYYSAQTTSDFLNQSGSDSKANFNFGDIGFVFNHPLSRNNDNQGWKSINFAIGYNRLNNFNTRTAYQGVNHSNSYLDYILQGVNAGSGTSSQYLDNFYQYPAFQTYLIDSIPGNSNYYTSAIPAGGGEVQRYTSETYGSTGELVLSMGANYGNRFYIGGTLGIDFLNYTENSNYQEIDPNNGIPDFNNFNLYQHINTYGTGINFKFGMIYSPIDWLRLGGAINTQTSYSMHDYYSTSMVSVFDNGQSYVYYSPQGNFDYKLNTPFKAIGSVAFIIGKRGLVSADYEYIDYSTMRLSSHYSSDFFDVNNTIQQKYTSTGNIKLGTEWKLGEAYRVRGGYAFFGSPFAAGQAVTGADQSQSSYSIGLGYRDKFYSLDFTYAYSVSNNYFQQYSLSDQAVPGAINKVQTNNFLLTFGFRF